MPGLLSSRDVDRACVDRLLKSARAYRKGHGRRHPNAILGLLFFEESVRTRIGFEIAGHRLGSRPVLIREAKHSTAMETSETVADVIRSVGEWCDVLCIRHPDPGVAARAAAAIRTPVINCGNGADEHPSQALVDIFAIDRNRGRVDGCAIGLVGDLDAMRVAHSLALQLCAFSDISLRQVCPPGLGLGVAITNRLRAAGHRVTEEHVLDPRGLDVLYVAGLPADTAIGRISAVDQAAFHVTPQTAAAIGPDGFILCPLPRVDEIDPTVDALSQARYFEQSRDANFMRMAILDELLSRA